MRSIMAASALVCFLSISATAHGETGDTCGTGEKLSFSGSVEFETAEMLKARKYGLAQKDIPQASKTVDHVWFGHAIGTFNVEGNPAPSLKVRAAFELRQYYMTMLLPENIQDQYLGRYQFTNFYLREGQGIFPLLRNGPVSLDMAVGLMPYKYNPEVRNLGEFLFRSGTYPLFLLGEFDRPFARVTGLRTGLKYDGAGLNAKLDVMALIEREIRPFNDISLAIIGNVSLLKVIDIGAGVDFARAIPVNSELTRPTSKGGSQYIIYNSDSTEADTGYYTFAGTKVMVRGTIDPFWMVRGNGGSLIGKLLGKNGGKLYGEIAAIGLKNYPANQIVARAGNPKGYTSFKERTPWMAGVTIPMWKVLDMCVFEIERFPSPNPDDYAVVSFRGLPVPSSLLVGPGYMLADYQPRWNWSLYMKKQIMSNFSMVCQMGRDHQRWETNMVQSGDYDFEAAMVKPDQWGWHLSGIFNF